MDSKTADYYKKIVASYGGNIEPAAKWLRRSIRMPIGQIRAFLVEAVNAP